MKTKELTCATLFIVSIFISLVLFTSCSDDKYPDIVNEKQVTKDFKIFISQEVFNELTVKASSSRAYDEISDNDVWTIISASFHIVTDGKSISIQDYFALFDKNGTETQKLILEKMFLFDNFDMPMSRAEKKLTLEEIRNAMMAECENGYLEPITTACKAAVLIAYYYKKATS